MTMSNPNPRTKRLTLAVVAVGTAVALAAAAMPAAAAIRGALRGKRIVKSEAKRELSPMTVLSDLLARLELTAAQKDQVKAILSAHKEELLRIATVEHTSRADLRSAIHRSEVDANAVTAAAATVARADMQLALERAAIFAEVYAVLSEAQRAELAAFAAEVKTTITERLAEYACGGFDPAKIEGRFGNRLGLTAEQIEQIGAIMRAYKGDLTAIVAGEIAARTALNAAIHQPVVNDFAVRRASLAVAAVDLTLDLERAELFAEIWGVLDGEQQAQLTELLATLEERIDTRVQALLTIFKALF
jgi:Spy/CpxP family protein refolding chaperone